MRNPLQEQLLKAGLVKKNQVSQVARDQAKQRQGKKPAPAAEEKIDARQLQAERAERDRAIAAGRNAQARAAEAQVQVRQIIETNKVKREGDIAYRFTDGEKIASVLVNEKLRSQLAAGTLAIARLGEGYELVPRVAAEKLYARDETAIVLDHGKGQSAPASEDDEYYKQFEVPDDLIW
jgi:uncharacterized protein YaiL (DUF2058 family)